jgi:hypothetical protein
MPPIRQTEPFAANCIADHLKAIAIFQQLILSA